MEPKVIDNPGRSRFELTIDGAVAIAAYERRPDRLVMTHTEVPEALSGRGVGSVLARGALDAIRAQGLKVVARCPFIASFIKRHPEYEDLVAAE
jgi:uncharacterized protein